MLRSPFHDGTSEDVQEPEANAAPSQSNTAAGVWTQHDPRTGERLRPPPASRREQPQRNPTAQPSDPAAHGRRSMDLLALNVQPPEPWQRARGANPGGSSIDDWLPPLPKARPAAPTAGGQGSNQPAQTAASPATQVRQPTEVPQSAARSQLQVDPQSGSPARADAKARTAAHGRSPAGAQTSTTHRPLPLGVQPIPAGAPAGAPAGSMEHLPIAARVVAPSQRAASSESRASSTAARTRVQTTHGHARPTHAVQPAAASQSRHDAAATAPQSRAPRADASSAELSRELRTPQLGAAETRARRGAEASPPMAASPRVESPRASQAARTGAAAAPTSAPQMLQRGAAQSIQAGTVEGSPTRSSGTAPARELHASEPEPLRSRAQSAELRRARPPQPPAAMPSQAPAAPASSSPPRARASGSEAGASRPPRPDVEDKWARSAQSDLTRPDAQIAQLPAPAPAPIARRGMISRASRPPLDLTLPNVPVAPDPTPGQQHAAAAGPQAPRKAAPSEPIQPFTPRAAAKSAAMYVPHSVIPDLSQSQALRSAATGTSRTESTSAAAELAQTRPVSSPATTPASRSAATAELYTQQSVSQSHAPRHGSSPDARAPSAPAESRGTGSVSISESRAVGVPSGSTSAHESRNTPVSPGPRSSTRPDSFARRHVTADLWQVLQVQNAALESRATRSAFTAEAHASTPPGVTMSDSHAPQHDARGFQHALAEPHVPSTELQAPQPQSALIELRALRDGDEQRARSEHADARIESLRLRPDDAALWSTSLHSAQVAYGRDAVRGSLQLNDSEQLPLVGLRPDSRLETEPVPLTMLRRAAWGRWLRAALGGVVLGVAASVAVGYAAVWMPRAEQMPVLLTAAPPDGPREALELPPAGEETSASAALDQAMQPSAAVAAPESERAAVSRAQPEASVATGSAEPSARSNVHAGPPHHSAPDVAAPDLAPGAADRGAEASPNEARPASAAASAPEAQPDRASASAVAVLSGADVFVASSSASAASTTAEPNAASRSALERDSVSSAAPPAAAVTSAAAREPADSTGPDARELSPSAASMNTSPREVAQPSAASMNTSTREVAPSAATANPSARESTPPAPDAASATRGPNQPPSAAFAALDEALASDRGAPAQPPAPAPTPTVASGPQPVLMVTPLAAAPNDAVPGLPDQPSREQVRDTMLGMHATMAACAAGKHGTTFANVTVQSDGRVSYSLIDGAFAGTQAGSCMARTLRSAMFPRFSGPPFKVRYPLVF